MTNTSKDILSDITVHMKYAKYIPELNRRETWEELVTRNMNMHIKKYPKLEDEIRTNLSNLAIPTILCFISTDHSFLNSIVLYRKTSLS